MIALLACVAEEAPSLGPGGWSDGAYLLALSETDAYFGDRCVIGADFAAPFLLEEDGAFAWTGVNRENASGSAERAVVLEGVVAEDIVAALRYADEEVPFVDVELEPDEAVSYDDLEFCSD